MRSTSEIQRVITVVLDGLRPDAIDAFDLKCLRRIACAGAASMTGRTVTPSLTWPALTSLLTGVDPRVHGILTDQTQIPRPRAKLHPLPQLLAREGYPSFAFMGDVPRLFRGIARHIARGLGFAEALFAGANAIEVVESAERTIRTLDRGFVFMHWADADRVGHEHCWMSPEYGEAARCLDSALGMLSEWIDLENDRGTLLILLADHGGGGVVDNHHADVHPLNYTIPMVLAGAGVMPGELVTPHLLDVPATVAWALGAAAHPSYAGRELTEAFGVAIESAVA